MHLSSLLIALASAGLSSAACVRRDTPPIPVMTIDGAWFESISVRENGLLVVTRLDVPELWMMDPLTRKAEKIASVPGALGLTGVTEIRHDVFGFAAGNFNTTDFTVEAGSWSVWTTDLTGEEPVTELLADVPEAGFLLGTATYGTNSMLVADAAEGKVYKFDAETGEYEVIIEDDLLKPAADAQIPEAIHSIRNFGEELYFTNTFGNAFGHFFLNAVTAEVGEVNIVTNLTSPLDFIIDGNGTSYVGQIGDGIVKVTQDGTVTPMWNITSATSLAFGRRKAEFDIIYAGTAVGELYALQIDW